MHYGKLQALCVAGTLFVTLAAPPATCQAGPIIDWLFGRHGAYYAQPIYAQPAYAQPAYATQANYCGNSCSPCGQAAQPVVTNYQPAYAYRTTWVQVPVTNYRPLYTAGHPATTVQPCTSYLWQARRVPTYSAFRPLYPTYAAPVASSGCSSCSSSNYAAPVVSSGCSSCGTMAPAAAPYYAPSTPTTTFGPTTSMPSTTVPGSSVGPTPSLSTPADQQPSLSPGGLPGSPSTIRNYPPYSPAPTSGSPSLPLNSPAAVKKPSGDRGLRLVPDPDTMPGLEEPNRAPRLLTPQDKTASVTRAWAATPIRWTGARTVRTAVAETPLPAVQSSTVNKEPQYDDSGWRSLRP